MNPTQKNRIVSSLASIVGMGVFVLLFIIGLVFFSYLLIIGGIIGLVLFAIGYVRAKFFLRKAQRPQQSHPGRSVHQGRTIDQKKSNQD